MNLGFPEMAFLFLLALLLFGPKKMPEIGRQLGRALAEFKKASDHFKMQIEDEVRNLEIENRNVTAPENTIAAHYEPSDVPPPIILPPQEDLDRVQQIKSLHDEAGYGNV